MGLTSSTGTARMAVKTLAALVGVAVTALLSARAADVYHPSHRSLVALVVAATVIAAGSTLVSAVAELRDQRGQVLRDETSVLLATAAWTIHDNAGFDPRDLGLAVYLVRRELLRPWRRRLSAQQRVRAARRPATSAVVWRPGKGVIGRCVSEGRDTGQDTDGDYVSLGQVTRAQWDTTVQDSVRLGLSYDEFLEVRGKYGAVIATPIIRDGRGGSVAIGCVALDGPPASHARLSRVEVSGALHTAAAALVHLV